MSEVYPMVVGPNQSRIVGGYVRVKHGTSHLVSGRKTGAYLDSWGVTGYEGSLRDLFVQRFDDTDPQCEFRWANRRYRRMTWEEVVNTTLVYARDPRVRWAYPIVGYPAPK